jgi:hypothetical protein
MSENDSRENLLPLLLVFQIARSAGTPDVFLTSQINR